MFPGASRYFQNFQPFQQISGRISLGLLRMEISQPCPPPLVQDGFGPQMVELPGGGMRGGGDSGQESTKESFGIIFCVQILQTDKREKKANLIYATLHIGCVCAQVALGCMHRRNFIVVVFFCVFVFFVPFFMWFGPCSKKHQFVSLRAKNHHFLASGIPNRNSEPWSIREGGGGDGRRSQNYFKTARDG